MRGQLDQPIAAGLHGSRKSLLPDGLTVEHHPRLAVCAHEPEEALESGAQLFTRSQVRRTGRGERFEEAEPSR